MTRDEVQDWLDRYVDAWRSYDADAIGELFSEDALGRVFSNLWEMRFDDAGRCAEYVEWYIEHPR
jgi:hypothetical protein